MELFLSSKSRSAVESWASVVGAAMLMLVEVLLLHRHLQHADVLAGLAAALVIGR